MGYKKISDDFKVTSIYELREVLNKDQREEEINKYNNPQINKRRDDA